MTDSEGATDAPTTVGFPPGGDDGGEGGSLAGSPETGKGEAGADGDGEGSAAGSWPRNGYTEPTGLDLNPEVRIWLFGECPVQAEGTIGGEPFYFRSRGNRWSLEVGARDGDGEPAFRYEEPYGDEPYVAGWIWHHEALALLARGFAVYHQWGRIGRTDRLAAMRANKDSMPCAEGESSISVPTDGA